MPRRSGSRPGSRPAAPAEGRAHAGAVRGEAGGRQRRAAGVRGRDPRGRRHRDRGRVAAARRGRPGGGAKARRPDQRAADRGRQPRRLRRLSRRPAGAAGHRPRPRPCPGAGRAHDPARRPADRLGKDVRPDAGCDRRRDPLRGLGRGRRSGRGARRVRENRVRALPPPWRGRADGRRDQPLDAGLDRRQPRARQSRLLQPERGPGQGPALRRQR